MSFCCTYHTGSGMKNRHVLKNCSTIVGDDNFTIAGLNLSLSYCIRTKGNEKGHDQWMNPHTILSIPLGPRDVRIASPTAK